MIRMIDTKPGDEVVCRNGKRLCHGTVVHLIAAQSGKGDGCNHGPLAVVCHRSNADDKVIDGTIGVRPHFGGGKFRTDYEVWGIAHLELITPRRARANSVFRKSK